jgi:hypothetical protein
VFFDLRVSIKHSLSCAANKEVIVRNCRYRNLLYNVEHRVRKGNWLQQKTKKRKFS